MAVLDSALHLVSGIKIVYDFSIIGFFLGLFLDFEFTEKLLLFELLHKLINVLGTGVEFGPALLEALLFS